MPILRKSFQFLICAAIAMGFCSHASATVLQLDSQGKLTIIGTSGDDEIQIHSHGEYSPNPRGLLIHYRNIVGVEMVQVFDDVQSLEICTCGGNDTVLYYAEYTGDIDIDTGSGDDDVRFIELPGELAYATGITTVVTGSGDDDIRTYDTSFDRLVIRSGSGNDDVWLSQSMFYEEVDLQTNRGSDFVSVWECISRAADIQLGRDNDVLVLSDSTFFGLTNFRGGTGDDFGSHYDMDFRSSYLGLGFEQGSMSEFRK